MWFAELQRLMGGGPLSHAVSFTALSAGLFTVAYTRVEAFPTHTPPRVANFVAHHPLCISLVSSILVHQPGVLLLVPYLDMADPRRYY